MITEDYVSNGVAKLLEEKGFDESCDYYYNPNDDGTRRLTLDDIWCKRGNFVKAPTHQMAMKWLREVHNLCISPYAAAYRYGFIIDKIDTGSFVCNDDVIDDELITYEEAVDAALKYALENLI